MCVYSAFVDSAQKQWPGLSPFPAAPWGPGIPSIVAPPPDPKILQEILDIGRRLDRIDKALGLKDCTQEAANKKAFEAQLEQLIKAATALQQLNAQNQANTQRNLDGSRADVQSGLTAGLHVGYGQTAPAKGLQST